MFLIYAKKDDSLTVVEESAVVCDIKTVKRGDEVKFVYGDKIHSGIVRMISGT